MRKDTKESKIKKFSPKMQASLLLVFCVIILLLVGLILRLVYLNNKDGEKYEKRVLSQQTYVSSVIPYRRGEILDRNGTKLATNEKVYNLVIDPKLMLSKKEFRTPTINAIIKCFDITEDEINKILKDKPKSQYIILRKELSYDVVSKFKKIESNDKKKLIKGAWFEEEYKRVYPYNNLASHAIGFTSKGNVGNWGLEEYYNEELNGSTGREYGYFDSELNLERNVKNAVNGDSLVTTLDANIQNIVEKHIKSFEKEVGSQKADVLVMNPNNGEIYAMATNNEYNLNDPRKLEGFYTKSQISKMSDEKKLEALIDIWRNFIISDTYEPGSTFKPITVAAGFEEGILNGNESYFCPGYKEVVKGVRIKCSHVHGHLNLKEVIMHSCNVGLMNIVKKEGKDIFTKYQKVFGFGTKTGIDLPGETDGILYPNDKMHAVDLATNSFGQNFNVNMLQLASAFSSIINGGHLYQPHLVKQIVNDKGATVKNIGTTLVNETVSQKTSEILKDYLYATVEGGTATGAQVKGIQVGGKTGTAEKHPRRQGKYLVSFIGAAPINDPQVVIYVVIDELKLDNQAQSGYATKLAGEILKEILPFLDIYPDTSSNEKSKQNTDTKNNTNEGNENDSKDASSTVNPSANQNNNEEDSNKENSAEFNETDPSLNEGEYGDVPANEDFLNESEKKNKSEKKQLEQEQSKQDQSEQNRLSND